MTNNLLLNLFVCLVFVNPFAYSQEDLYRITNNTYDDYSAKQYDLYSQWVSESSAINNGAEYFYDHQYTGGWPYYEARPFQNGSVIYEGEMYDSLQVGYDIYRDELFIARYDQQGVISIIKLPSEKVSAFFMAGRKFVRLQDTGEVKNHPGTGFYNIIYNDNLKAFIKRKKKIVPSHDGIYRYVFEESNKYYVLRDDSFHHIRKKRNLRKLLDDKKRDIRQFIRSSRAHTLNLRDYIVTICRYYDSQIRVE